MQSARNWGDGHTDRARHTIADIQYGPRSSALRCSDGTTLQAPTPEGLEALWQKHGGRLLDVESEDRRDPEPFIDAGRSVHAMGAIVAIGLDCTCSPGSDITTCPNYTPSMDDGMEDE